MATANCLGCGAPVNTVAMKCLACGRLEPLQGARPRERRAKSALSWAALLILLVAVSAVIAFNH